MKTAKVVRYGLAVVVLVALGALAYQWWNATHKARAADSRADSIARVAEAHRVAADSALAAFRRTRSAEASLRDSLSVLRAEAEQDARDATEQTEVATDSLEAVLDGLLVAVRDPLKPAVRTGQVQLDSIKAAHERYRVAMEKQVSLLARDTLSLSRTLRSAETALDTTRRALKTCRAECDAIREARDKWRRAARSNLFGLPSGVTHVATGVLGLILGLAVN